MKLTKKYYQDSIEEHSYKKNHFVRIISSFFFGGLICLFGQIIYSIAELFTEYSLEVMLFTIILISVITTSLGFYDKLGQIAYAGTIVPISGFANSVASSAMEYKPEGLLLGIAANTLKLAGTVIVCGVVATIIVGLLRIGFGLI